MANENPIKLDDRPVSPTEYSIPSEHMDTMIYITVKVQLEEKGWQYAAFHAISLRGKDIYPNKIPEPTDLKLDYGSSLVKGKLFLTSHISRIRNNSDDDTPTVVNYFLRIEAGDILLDEFTMASDTNNPSNFYSFLLFKSL